MVIYFQLVPKENFKRFFKCEYFSGCTLFLTLLTFNDSTQHTSHDLCHSWRFVKNHPAIPIAFTLGNRTNLSSLES
jgi:hypothetical protein